MKIFGALLLVFVCACGRNEERRVTFADITGVLRDSHEGVYQAGSGNTIELKRNGPEWEVGLGVHGTIVVSMEITIDGASQRSVVNFVFPERPYGDPFKDSVRSSLAANQIGFFGQPVKTQFEVDCTYSGFTKVERIVFIPTVPKGSKAKYDWDLQQVKAVMPDANLAILTRYLYLTAESIAAAEPIGEHIATLSDQPMKVDVMNALKRGCEPFAPMINNYAYYSGIGLASISDTSLDVISSHAIGNQGPVVYKTERERRFRKIR